MTTWLTGQATIVHLAVGLSALTVLAASLTVVRRLTLPVLRLLEGYWPSRLNKFAARRRRKILDSKSEDKETSLQLRREWKNQPPEEQLRLTAEQRAERVEQAAILRAKLAKFENKRRHRPVQNGELLPTRIGNILRAAETRPYHRYGLDAVVVWPRLWLILPDQARTELSSARSALDASVAAAIWGTAFIAFTPWAWWAAPTFTPWVLWAAPVGIAVTVAAIQWWIPARAEVFADLIEATYDLYRWDLYKQLHLPMPDNAADEISSGKALTKYLLRGSSDPHFQFTHETAPDSLDDNNGVLSKE
ncbi:hypothetical protein [Kocuria sp. NPDC057446]|uniref:hypothetical protein n=1 Tax=Kocuria sp. NPDC057446 TaxID=3346137 RepID=UPI0036965344